MSSRLLPLVSGTKNRQNRKVTNMKPEKIQKAFASESEATSIGKNFVTTKANVQLNDVEREDAKDLISGEKSSDIINQGIGPKPSENADTKTERDVTGTNSILLTNLLLCSKV